MGKKVLCLFNKVVENAFFLYNYAFVGDSVKDRGSVFLVESASSSQQLKMLHHSDITFPHPVWTCPLILKHVSHYM